MTVTFRPNLQDGDINYLSYAQAAVLGGVSHVRPALGTAQGAIRFKQKVTVSSISTSIYLVFLNRTSTRFLAQSVEVVT